MYSYQRLFVGIPLSQFNEKLQSKNSIYFIKNIAILAEEQFDFKNVSEKELDTLMEQEFFHPESKLFMKNLVHNYQKNSLFQEFIDNEEVGFYHDAKGMNTATIFGFYVDHLMPIPDNGAAPFSIDLDKINTHNYQFRNFFKHIIPKNTWNCLEHDNLIGIFYNTHTI